MLERIDKLEQDAKNFPEQLKKDIACLTQFYLRIVAWENEEKNPSENKGQFLERHKKKAQELEEIHKFIEVFND